MPFSMGVKNCLLASRLNPLSPPSLSRKPIPRCSGSSSTSPRLIGCLEIQSIIQNSGVIACLRASSAELAYEAASVALTSGISALEITMATPGVFEVLDQLVWEHPNSALGVGTVLCIEDARRAIKIGAKFLMSPATVEGILDECKDSDVLYIPGAMTPTEILSVHQAGANLVKVYPVSALGGVKYIAALKKSFPHIPTIASQGITMDSVGEFICCGASAVVLSDSIFRKEVLEHRNFETLQHLANLASQNGKEAVLFASSSS